MISFSRRCTKPQQARALSSVQTTIRALRRWYGIYNLRGRGCCSQVLQGAASLLLDPSKISLAEFLRAIVRDSSCSARCVKIVAVTQEYSMEYRGVMRSCAAECLNSRC
jgi:hypothetical protein